jgi:pimeloyl-ACP methyl ester carboxylesterase
MPTFNGRGFKIHYVEEGKGPAVVFAHGFCMDHTMYAAQFEDLPDSYRCTAWDMRGHGRSECPPGPWTMQDLVVDLIAFIEGVNARPCHLVGMSIGGMIGMRVAMQREDLVRSLVLIDTTAGVYPDDLVSVYRGFQEQIAENDGIPDELAEGTLPIFYGPTYMDANPEALKFHIEREQAMPATALVQGLEALIGRDSLIERLGEIRVPTLVIHGEVDQALDVTDGEALAEGIPGADLIRVPDAGHTTPLETPDVVNEALAGFFARVKR